MYVRAEYEVPDGDGTRGMGYEEVNTPSNTGQLDGNIVSN